MPQPSFASGAIFPRRFVTISGAFLVAQSTAGQQIWGISQPNVHGAPGTPWDDGYAANPSTTDPTANYNELLVFQEGETTIIDCGLPVTAGNRLKSDGNGRAIPTTADGDQYGAIAIEGAAASGTTIRCTVILGQVAS